MYKLTLIPIMLALAASPAEAQQAPSKGLLEQGIYAEETIGNLNQAIAIYNKIIQDEKARRPEVAQALFRLAVCHSNLGQKSKANQFFRQLMKEYPDQTALVAEARKLATQDQIALSPVPWENGEVAFYEIKGFGGGKMGAAAFSVTETLVNRVPAWKLSTYTSLLAAGLSDYTDTHVAKDDFAALSGTYVKAVLSRNRIDIDYKKGGLHIDSLAKGTKTANDIAINQPYYNDLQMHDLIRRLPLKSGYRTEFTLFVQSSTLPLDARLEIKGLEKVSVPAGEFDCYRVEIETYQQGKPAQEMTYWVSSRTDRQIVKVLNTAVTYELTAIANRNSQPLAYQKQSLKASLTTPQGWMPLEVEPMQPGHDLWLTLIPDGGHSFALLAATQKLKAANDDKNVQRVKNVVDSDFKALAVGLPGFKLRPESRTDLTVSGASAQRFIADFEADGKPMVEYRTYILAPSGLFWFTFRTERDTFDEKQAEYDAIVSSLTLQ